MFDRLTDNCFWANYSCIIRKKVLPLATTPCGAVTPPRKVSLNYFMRLFLLHYLHTFARLSLLNDAALIEKGCSSLAKTLLFWQMMEWESERLSNNSSNNKNNINISTSRYAHCQKFESVLLFFEIENTILKPDYYIWH